MGNQAVVPPNYRQFTHPQFKDSRFNKNQQLLELRTHPGESYSHWRWNLSPLDHLRKHLFLPLKFEDPDLLSDKNESSWCNSNGQRMSKEPMILAQYEPFIYTLENQILTRKANNSIFREHQLWKILKSGAFAIKDWSEVYKDITLGYITPMNILFNNEGQVRVANRFSFLSNREQPPQYAYVPPFSPQNTIKSAQTPQSLSIFSLGVCLLDAVSLNQSRYSTMATIQKKEMLQNSNLYPLQIKKVIMGMSEPQMKNRLGLKDIFESLVEYRRASRDKFQ